MTIDHASPVPGQRTRHPPPATGRRRGDDYDHLTSLLVRFAELDENHPDRARLRDTLVRGFHPVVVHIAGRYRGRGESTEDLEQAGALGLINAVDRFSPDRGSAFLAFAVPTITGEIRRHFRDRSWAIHVPRRVKELQAALTAAQQQLSGELGRAPRSSELAARLDVSVEDVIDALTAQGAYTARSLDLPVNESGTTVGDLVADRDDRIGDIDAWMSVRPAIDQLPERERTILMMRFHGNMTQTQIGEQIGVSQMHVSRLLSRTLADLRGHLVDG